MPEIILAAGIIFLIALLFARVLVRARLPAVTAYLLAGLLVGPYCFNFIPSKLLDASDLVANVALGLIAFTLGENFEYHRFKRLGKSVLVLSVGEVIGAFTLITLACTLAGLPFYVAILLGGIGPASAPAATVMVAREYKAKGPFTDRLLGIVAIDDAWDIMCFSIAVAIATTMTLSRDGAVGGEILFALREIFGGLGLGALLGWLLSLFNRFLREDFNRLICILGFILAAVGLSFKLNFSPLLANIALGAVVVNLTRRRRVFDLLRGWDWPIYLFFFVLAGASLELSLLKTIGFIVAIYVIGRMSGLYLGALISGSFIGEEKRVRENIGMGLFPQAGVALAQGMMVKGIFGVEGNMIFNVTVASTIFFEIIGPLFTRWTLQRAGEIPPSKGGKYS